MESQRRVSIIVDDRECKNGIPALLRSRGDVEVRIERLSLGDYRVDDLFLFERKTLVDLVGSIKDGRLFAQGCRLAGASLRAGIILEGTGRDLAVSGMRREAIQGALVTLTLFLGIPLLRSKDQRETVQLMLFAARQGHAIAASALPRRGRRPRGKRRVQTRVLQGLPGVGPERAARLLDQFGTLEAVMAASTEELAGVTGIGMGTAEAIRWAVKEIAAEYRADQVSILPPMDSGPEHTRSSSHLILF